MKNTEKLIFFFSLDDSTERDRLINYTELLWKQTNHICRQTLFASSYKCNWFENTVPDMQLKTTDLRREKDDKRFDESTHLHNLIHMTVNTTESDRLWQCAVHLEWCPSMRMASFNVMRLLGRLPGPLLFVLLQLTCPCCRWKLSSTGDYCVCVCVCVFYKSH